MTPEEEEAALLALPPAPPEETLRYGPHPSQVIDYYGLGGARRRVTVLHGGFWREAYDRTHLSPLAAELARRGFAVALVEYRRVGGGGGWPATFDDVARAVATAWGDADQALLGHSAGGQLALWAAAHGEVTGVVAVSPVADLGYALELGLSDGAVAELLGEGGELASVDPMRLPRVTAPTVILHGTDDLDVPVEISRRYAVACGARLRELAGVGHYAPLIPGSAAFPELLAALADAR
ncbi:alpha/beta hydrolase family protein [Streptantibioticus ferralitis]|uniref:Alpha/beta hydrolase n=1 Tax=Streptantibioticus ferralitis TaxID=236510 RepID=A0ABT5Z7U9_9ACTN|nr:alpha/beta hydrolase [Streptantibioticus ferralitis]MDF2259893.1 alpha/beta hydrolase [Streptantibioticus ferralitis]